MESRPNRESLLEEGGIFLELPVSADLLVIAIANLTLRGRLGSCSISSLVLLHFVRCFLKRSVYNN